MNKRVWKSVLALVLALEMAVLPVNASARVQQVNQSRFGQIAVGLWDTALLGPDGTVKVTGNDYNQDVEQWRGITQIQYDASYILYGVTNRGSVICAGSPLKNELQKWKNISALAISTQTYGGDQFFLGLCKDGTVTAYAPSGYSLSGISGWKDITAIAAGERHAVGLMKNGSVVAVGSNEYGQCAVSGWRNVTEIAASKNVTVGLRSDGKVLAAGDISQHEKDVIAKWRNIRSVAIGDNVILGLREDGRVEWSQFFHCNDMFFEAPEGLPANWTDVDAIFGSPYGMAAFRKDGSMILIGSWLTSATFACQLTNNTEQHQYWLETDWPKNRTLTCALCGKTITVPQNTTSAGKANCQHYWEVYPKSNERYDDHFMMLLRETTYFCAHCGAMRNYGTTELADLRIARDSNSREKQDIIMGKWKLQSGREWQNSLRFWVLTKAGYDNTEYVEYNLGGKYDQLTYEVGIEASSRPKTDISFTIFGDGVQLDTVQVKEGEENQYHVNVKGVQTLRISCTNKASANGYGVFWGILFKPMEF